MAFELSNLPLRIRRVANTFDKESVEFLSILEGKSKYCNTCKKSKSINDYHLDKCKSDGLCSICKSCKSLYGLKKEKAFNPKSLFAQYKRNAKHRGYLFELTLEDFLKLEHSSCHYCGNEDKILGYDRINNHVGYISSNIVPCCDLCNYMKSDLERDNWFEHMKKILMYKEKN